MYGGLGSFAALMPLEAAFMPVCIRSMRCWNAPEHRFPISRLLISIEGVDSSTDFCCDAGQGRYTRRPKNGKSVFSPLECLTVIESSQAKRMRLFISTFLGDVV